MSKEKFRNERFPDGATELVWDEGKGRLVLRVPKNATEPEAPAPQPDARTAIIDRILAGTSKDA